MRQGAFDVHRAVNVHASPLKFEIDPPELLALYSAIEERDASWARSTTRTCAARPIPLRPTSTSPRTGRGWSGSSSGLTDGEAPEVRSYLIEGGQVREVALEVE